MEPAPLVDLLNEYLDGACRLVMADAEHEHGHHHHYDHNHGHDHDHTHDHHHHPYPHAKHPLGPESVRKYLKGSGE